VGAGPTERAVTAGAAIIDTQSASVTGTTRLP